MIARRLMELCDGKIRPDKCDQQQRQQGHQQQQQREQLQQLEGQRERNMIN